MSTTTFKLMCSVALVTTILAGKSNAQQGPVLTSGDAIVTGFSGKVPASATNPSPTIDLNGASARIMSLGAANQATGGQTISVPTNQSISASQVGQVFAIAIDKGTNGSPPNIYLGATSLFGLHIVERGGGELLETGEPGAKFMDGQFGPDGSAGSIWRIDGNTGQVSEFARLPENSGAGVGDVVYDPVNNQFYAADLDNGLIYRISADGAIIDSFDHGVIGLPTTGQPAVNDDGSKLNIADFKFVATDPATWAYTQSERRVWGMAFNNGRLYYATETGPQIWSVGISGDGSFANDPKSEITVENLPGPGPITDITFDKSGQIYLAQRGAQRPGFNFTQFAEPNQSSVLRYVPALSGNGGWEPGADQYAVGIPAEHDASNGGVAIGLGQSGKCGETLWSTGGRLVSASGPDQNPANVHGLQGSPINLVRPENTPPLASWFVDYDGELADPQNSGQMGDVEIFQSCPQAAEVPPEQPAQIAEGVEHQYPPGYFPPLGEPHADWPGDFPPPERSFQTNLILTKKATPKECLEFFGGWSCQYNVRVQNIGGDAYFGDVAILDSMPAAPAGAFFGFGAAPPWSCWSAGPSSMQCWRPNVLINPGQFIDLNVSVWLPTTYDRCRLRNFAEITWAPGGTQWNTNPDDDQDGASATIPSKKCLPVHLPVGSAIHLPKGSVHRPRGSIHRPRGSVHRPRGSVHRPRGSVHRPRGSVHRPRGSVHRPRGSVHRPRGSVHRPRGSVHRPRGSVHRPRGSVHRPRGSVHRPRGSVHRPRGSVHRPRGSVHRPRGSVHRPRGSVHRPRGSVHRPRGSAHSRRDSRHRPRGSRTHHSRRESRHRPRGSRTHHSRRESRHRPRGSRTHRRRDSRHRPRGSRTHRRRDSRHRPRGSRTHRRRDSRQNQHRPRGSRTHRRRDSRQDQHRPRGSRTHRRRDSRQNQHRPRGSRTHRRRDSRQNQHRPRGSRTHRRRDSRQQRPRRTRERRPNNNRQRGERRPRNQGSRDRRRRNN